MKCVYEAANNIEAHMIANLLEQQNIAARVEGEFLTGGVGELPAAGLIRVVADESDFERAREIILQWEKQAPPETAPPVTRKPSAPLAFIAGVALAIAATSFMNRSLVSNDGIDFDADGELDERYYYNGRTISRVEKDANFDRRIDAIFKYDSHGLLYAAEQDVDFDGVMEVKTSYEKGNVRRTSMDMNRNGSVDLQQDFVFGVIVSATYFAAESGNVRKREFYDRGILVRDEFDSDNDGKMDTYRKYDHLLEVIETTRK